MVPLFIAQTPSNLTLAMKSVVTVAGSGGVTFGSGAGAVGSAVSIVDSIARNLNVFGVH